MDLRRHAQDRHVRLRGFSVVRREADVGLALLHARDLARAVHRRDARIARAELADSVRVAVGIDEALLLVIDAGADIVRHALADADRGLIQNRLRRLCLPQ